MPFHDVHEPYEAEDRFLDERIEDNGRQTMAAMVSCVSEGTGNVSRALREAGMWETTLFIWCVRREHLVDATPPLPRCSRLRCRWLATRLRRSGPRITVARSIGSATTTHYGTPCSHPI